MVAIDERTDPETETDLCFNDVPIRLSGAPPLCEGTVFVCNPGSRMIRVGRAVLQTRDPAITALTRTGLVSPSGAVSLPLRMFAAIEPGEVQEVTMELAIPHGTPPGHYTGSVIAPDGAERHVEIVVEAHERLQVQPPAFAPAVMPGSRISLPVRIKNLGNVPTALPTGGQLPLTALDHITLEADSDDDPTGDSAPALVSMLAEFAAETLPQGSWQLQASTGPLTPMAVQACSLHIEIPAALPPGRRYAASLAFGTARLNLTLRVTANLATGQPNGHAAASDDDSHHLL